MKRQAMARKLWDKLCGNLELIGKSSVGISTSLRSISHIISFHIPHVACCFCGVNEHLKMSRPVTDRVMLLCQERSDPDPAETEVASPSEPTSLLFHTISLLCCPRQPGYFAKKLETIVRSRLRYLHAEHNHARYRGYHGFIASSVPSPQLFPSNRP